jgi:hypothetical protein
MYCSSCGADVTPGLSYCNRCGANLKPTEVAVSSSRPWTLTLIAWFGLLMMGTPFPAMVIVLEAVVRLKEAGFPINHIVALAFFSLAFVFGAVVMIGRMLAPVFKAYLELGLSARPMKPEAIKASPEIAAHARARLEAHEPISSVTEGTTRAFEPIYRERKVE